MALKTLDECADRIEAGRAYFGLENNLYRLAGNVRKGQIDLIALTELRRESDRLVEACKSIDRLVAIEQGRVPA